MTTSNTFSPSIATRAFSIAAIGLACLAGAPAAAASPDPLSAPSIAYKPVGPKKLTVAPGSYNRNKLCEYEYQGRCVTWYTGESTCYHIFETSQPDHRKKACTIWIATGHMYVEG